VLVATFNVIPQARPVRMPKIFRHQHRELSTKHFVSRVAENSRGSSIHKQDPAAFVDGDYCVGGFSDYAGAIDKVMEGCA
jgi:hypothetical protein